MSFFFFWHNAFSPFPSFFFRFQSKRTRTCEARECHMVSASFFFLSFSFSNFAALQGATFSLTVLWRFSFLVMRLSSRKCVVTHTHIKKKKRILIHTFVATFFLLTLLNLNRIQGRSELQIIIPRLSTPQGAAYKYATLCGANESKLTNPPPFSCFLLIVALQYSILLSEHEKRISVARVSNKLSFNAFTVHILQSFRHNHDFCSFSSHTPP